MIIKSMSRKEPSFKQLLEYIQKEQTGFSFQLNMYGIKNYEILEEFQENYSRLKKQANSNALYHEIISLKKEDGVAQEDLERALEDLSYMYAQARAKDCLVYAGMHDEEEHLHCHLMISSNEIDATKNHYMSKHQFQDLKKQVEAYALEQYPEIKQEKVIDKKKDKKRQKTDERENQYRKRTGKQTKKDIAREKISTVLTGEASTREELFNEFSRQRMKLYKRGKNYGVVDEKDGRKYRLKTLGLEEEFKAIESRFGKSQAGASAEGQKKTAHENDEMPQADAERLKRFEKMTAKRKEQIQKEYSKENEYSK